MLAAMLRLLSTTDGLACVKEEADYPSRASVWQNCSSHGGQETE